VGRQRGAHVSIGQVRPFVIGERGAAILPTIGALHVDSQCYGSELDWADPREQRTWRQIIIWMEISWTLGSRALGADTLIRSVTARMLGVQGG
jgi:hypothetical protein